MSMVRESKQDAAEREFNYYTLGYSVRSQLILGSEDQRHGGGFSLACGRKDPKLRSGNVPGELIWEAYFMNTTSEGVGDQSAPWPQEPVIHDGNSANRQQQQDHDVD